MTEKALKLALEALEKLWDIIDDIDTYGDMAKGDEKLYRSLVERRQRTRFEETGITSDGYVLNGGAITSLRQAIAEYEELDYKAIGQQAYESGYATGYMDCAVKMKEAEKQKPVVFLKDWSDWRDMVVANIMRHGKIDKHLASDLANHFQNMTPQRQPLTKEQRIQIVKDNTIQGYHGDYFDAWGIIDDVEAAHGIKE